ncbi:MAG: hypothetical protein ACKVQS_11040 [Fimbriimonadaceae bacterium]
MLKTSGKVHWITIGGLLGLLLLAFVFLSAGDTPQSRAAIFMSALSRGDYKTLADSTIVEGKSKEELEAAWKKTVEDAKYYRFTFEIRGMQPTGDTAQIRMGVWRNYTPGAYDENFGLDMVKKGKRWYVRGNGISREMYPFLPRFE